MVGGNPKPREGTARARAAAGGKVCPAAASLSASSAKDPQPGLVARIPAEMPTRAASRLETATRPRCSPTRKARAARG